MTALADLQEVTTWLRSRGWVISDTTLAEELVAFWPGAPGEAFAISLRSRLTPEAQVWVGRRERSARDAAAGTNPASSPAGLPPARRRP